MQIAVTPGAVYICKKFKANKVYRYRKLGISKDMPNFAV